MSSSQKKAIKEFKSVTGCTEKVAKDVLSKHGNNLEAALDAFFNQAGTSAPSKKGDSGKLSKVFDGFAGSGEEKDIMAEDGLQKFFEQTGIDSDGPMTMILSWKLQAKSMGEITRGEFTQGFGVLGCDKMEKIKAAISSWENILKRQNEQYKQFYRWVFDFCKETDERKTLDKGDAVDFWQLCLPTSIFPLRDKFLEFIANDASVKTVTKDLWAQVYEFAADVRPDLSNWDDNGAWPVAIDDFVVMLQEEAGK